MPKTAKVFMSGRSQAVRLPVEFRFNCPEVFIEKQGDMVILRPKPQSWDDFFARTPRVPEDFLADRGDEPPQDREFFHDVDA